MSKKHRKIKMRVSEINPKGITIDKVIGQPAFLGLSVTTLLTADLDWLEIFLNWSESRFEFLTILLGDHIHRHNLVGKAGRTQNTNDVAADLAMDVCRPIRKNLQKRLNEITTGGVRLLSTLEIYNSQDFPHVRTRVTTFYEQDQSFHRLVNEDIDSFILRRSKRGHPSRILRTNCLNYLLEELAIFTLMVESGSLVHLYMGTHSAVLKAIANNEVRSPTKGLTKQICVDLYLSKTK